MNRKSWTLTRGSPIVRAIIRSSHQPRSRGDGPRPTSANRSRPISRVRRSIAGGVAAPGRSVLDRRHRPGPPRPVGSRPTPSIIEPRTAGSADGSRAVRTDRDGVDPRPVLTGIPPHARSTSRPGPDPSPDASFTSSLNADSRPIADDRSAIARLVALRHGNAQVSRSIGNVKTIDVDAKEDIVTESSTHRDDECAVDGRAEAWTTRGHEVAEVDHANGGPR